MVSYQSQESHFWDCILSCSVHPQMEESVSREAAKNEKEARRVDQDSTPAPLSAVSREVSGHRRGTPAKLSAFEFDPGLPSIGPENQDQNFEVQKDSKHLTWAFSVLHIMMQW